MAKTFSKIGKDIAIAVKLGIQIQILTLLLEDVSKCKGANMPKDNVERAIKKASGADAEHCDEVTAKDMDKGWCSFFVECTTNNSTRTVAKRKSDFSISLMVI